MKVRRRLPKISIKLNLLSKPNWTTLFCIGFFIGTIMVQLSKKRWDFYYDFFPTADLRTLKNLQIDSGEYLFFILKERLLLLVFLVILSATRFGVVLLRAFVLTCGFLCSAIISSAVLQFGIVGCLLSGAIMFPHMLFYLPVIYVILNLGYEFCIRKHYSNQKLPEGSNKLQLKEQISRFFLLGVVVIIGILMECYVNPFVLKIFLKIFL